MFALKPFAELPLRLFDSLLGDFVLAFTFFTALGYAVLGRHFGRQRPAAAMSIARGLALATIAAGVLAGIAQFGLQWAFQLGGILRERSPRYEQLVNDPLYVVWAVHRQTPVEIPLRQDEWLAGAVGCSAHAGGLW